MMELCYDRCFAGGLRIAVMLSYLSWNYRKAVMLQGSLKVIGGGGR